MNLQIPLKTADDQIPPQNDDVRFDFISLVPILLPIMRLCDTGF